MMQIRATFNDVKGKQWVYDCVEMNLEWHDTFFATTERTSHKINPPKERFKANKVRQFRRHIACVISHSLLEPTINIQSPPFSRYEGIRIMGRTGSIRLLEYFLFLYEEIYPARYISSSNGSSAVRRTATVDIARDFRQYNFRSLIDNRFATNLSAIKMM